MKAKIIILVVAFAILSACTKLNPDGKIITQTRNISGFTSVELTNSSNVVINTGGQFYVALKGSDNIINNIETVVKDGRLVIKTAPGIHLRNNDVTLNIEMPYVAAIKLSGSGNIKALCDSSSTKLSATNSASGDINVSGIDIHEISVDIS